MSPAILESFKRHLVLMTLKIGSIVRPANDGEDSKGILKWTKLRGKVVDLWEDCGELKVQVRWFRKSPYPTVVPAYFLETVTL